MHIRSVSIPLETYALFYYQILGWGVFYKQLNTWCELFLAAGRWTQLKFDATWTHSRVDVARELTQWRFIVVQIKDEAAQREDKQLRAVVQIRCPETFLPLLVQASWWQGLRDTAHPPPQCTPREGSARCSSSKAQHSGNVKNHKELNSSLTWMLLVHTDRGGCPEGAVFLFNYAHKRY